MQMSVEQVFDNVMNIATKRLLAAGMAMFCVLYSGLFSTHSAAQDEAASTPILVTIAAYEFPPFYSQHMSTHVLGELVTSLNNLQQQYRFSIRQVPVTARYQALLAGGCCDLMLFESPQWGWQPYLQSAAAPTKAIQASPALLAGAERLVAKRSENVDFSQLENIRLGGIRGYHYSFSDDLPETGALESGAGIYLADTIETNIKLVLSGRLDRVMLSDAYLASIAHTALARQFTLAEHADSRYQLHVLVNENKALSLAQVTALLERLRESGEWEALLRQFNLLQFDLSASSSEAQG